MAKSSNSLGRLISAIIIAASERTTPSGSSSASSIASSSGNAIPSTASMSFLPTSGLSAGTSTSVNLVGIVASAIRTGISEASATTTTTNAASFTPSSAVSIEPHHHNSAQLSAKPSRSLSPNPTPDLHYSPSLWDVTAPTVTCQPPCNVILPPYTLSSETTFSWSPLTTTLTEQWSSGTDVFTTTRSTVLTFEAITTSIIPLFNLNITAAGASQYSITPSLFPVANGTLSPPPGVTPTSPLPFSVTSFPPAQSSAQSSQVPLAVIPGLPVHLGFQTGPIPPEVCLVGCSGISGGGGFGSKCILFCNSCGATCSPGGSSGGTGPKQCVGDGCPPPGGGSHKTGSGGGPGPSPKTKSPEKTTRARKPTTTPSKTEDHSSSQPQSSSQIDTSSSSTLSCGHSVTVTDCRATCTDTSTSGSIVSQTSCPVAHCHNPITGCSGAVTGTTSTTRTTTSAPGCPYVPPLTNWWTDENQVLPTLPAREDMTWIWTPIDGWSILASDSNIQTVKPTGTGHQAPANSSAAQLTSPPATLSKPSGGSLTTRTPKSTETYTSAIQVVYARTGEDSTGTGVISTDAFILWAYDGPVPSTQNYCNQSSAAYLGLTDTDSTISWSDIESEPMAIPFPNGNLGPLEDGKMPGGQKTCFYTYNYKDGNGGVFECETGLEAPVTCTTVDSPFKTATSSNCENNGPTTLLPTGSQTFLPVARCQWSGSRPSS